MLVWIGKKVQALPPRPVKIIVARHTMARPTDVRALPGFSIWIRYDDGAKGEADLSDLAGRGVFGAWKDRTFFESVRLGSHGAIEWGDQIDLCPDAIYMRLTGKSPEEVFPALKKISADA